MYIVMDMSFEHFYIFRNQIDVLVFVKIWKLKSKVPKKSFFPVNSFYKLITLIGFHD